MTITIDVPETIVQEAEARGIAVETLVTEKLTSHICDEFLRRGFTRFGPPTKTVEEAAESILENRKRYTLGGEVTIKQLIEEGRRY